MNDELRTWNEGDPEPADHPAIIDRDGVVHLWTDDQDGFGNKSWNQQCITHFAEGGITGGVLDEDWADILSEYGPVREATPDEADIVVVRYPAPVGRA